MSGMELSEFLLARIAEDELEAVESCDVNHPMYAVHCTGGHPNRRRLAECEAKRRIVEAAWGDHLRIEGEWGHGRNREELSARNDYPEVVLLLALPYADHPDYRPEWKP